MSIPRASVPSVTLQAVVAAALNTDSPGRWKSPGIYQFPVGPDETVSGLQRRASEIAELAKRASVISYVRSDAPPILIIHGTEDFQPYSNVENFVDAMRRAGAENVVLMAFHREGHGAFIRQLALTGPAMRAFFDETISR